MPWQDGTNSESEHYWYASQFHLRFETDTFAGVSHELASENYGNLAPNGMWSAVWVNITEIRHTQSHVIISPSGVQ